MMRADNSIYFRISSDEKMQFQQAAANDNLNLSQWLKKLATQRVIEQKEGPKAAFKND